MDASSVPARRAETIETVNSSQGGAVDASSVLAGRAEIRRISNLWHRPRERQRTPPGPVREGSTRAQQLGRLPPTVTCRTRGQSQCLENKSAQHQLGIQREVENAMSAAMQKWTGFGSILENTSWTTEDAMVMITEGPAAKKNKGELSVCMPSGFPGDVEPPPQSVSDL